MPALVSTLPLLAGLLATAACSLESVVSDLGLLQTALQEGHNIEAESATLNAALLDSVTTDVTENVEESNEVTEQAKEQAKEEVKEEVKEDVKTISRGDKLWKEGVQLWKMLADAAGGHGEQRLGRAADGEAEEGNWPWSRRKKAMDPAEVSDLSEKAAELERDAKDRIEEAKRLRDELAVQDAAWQEQKKKQTRDVGVWGRFAHKEGSANLAHAPPVLEERSAPNATAPSLDDAGRTRSVSPLGEGAAPEPPPLPAAAEGVAVPSSAAAATEPPAQPVEVAQPAPAEAEAEGSSATTDDSPLQGQPEAAQSPGQPADVPSGPDTPTAAAADADDAAQEPAAQQTAPEQPSASAEAPPDSASGGLGNASSSPAEPTEAELAAAPADSNSAISSTPEVQTQPAAVDQAAPTSHPGAQERAANQSAAPVDAGSAVDAGQLPSRGGDEPPAPPRARTVIGRWKAWRAARREAKAHAEQAKRLRKEIEAQESAARRSAAEKRAGEWANAPRKLSSSQPRVQRPVRSESSSALYHSKILEPASGAAPEQPPAAPAIEEAEAAPDQAASAAIEPAGKPAGEPPSPPRGFRLVFEGNQSEAPPPAGGEAAPAESQPDGAGGAGDSGLPAQQEGAVASTTVEEAEHEGKGEEVRRQSTQQAERSDDSEAQGITWDHYWNKFGGGPEREPMQDAEQAKEESDRGAAEEEAEQEAKRAAERQTTDEAEQRLAREAEAAREAGDKAQPAADVDAQARRDHEQPPAPAQEEATTVRPGAPAAQPEHFSQPTEMPAPAAPRAPPLQVSKRIASAAGDPHMVNVHGQRFDIFKPGVHTLVQVPKWADAPHTLLRVEADAQRLGGACSDLYFTALNLTGQWVPVRHGIQFHSDSGSAPKRKWQRFGKVELKVVRGHTAEGVAYLNVFAKHLTETGLAVGGLLGEDDHTVASTPEPRCRKSISLLQSGEVATAHHLQEQMVLQADVVGTGPMEEGDEDDEVL